MRFVTIGLALLSLAAAPPAGARVTEGETLEPVQLKTLGGGTEALVSRVASANIILFWRPGQDASLDTLRQMARCEKLFVGKSVHMVAVVSAPTRRASSRTFGCSTATSCTRTCGIS